MAISLPQYSGPPRRSVAQKGPSADEKIDSLSASLGQYEAKVTGLETEMDAQKKDYEEKIKGERNRSLVCGETAKANVSNAL